MKTRVLSIAVMLGYALLGYGQNSLQQGLPKVIPPTPEATSLAKFTEVPISKYTGTANVSIPFYTIKEGSVSIPVGLSYHTRGVKVAEIASRVGLGWALNYGGAISRQIRGEADESRYGYFSQRDTWKGFLTNQSKRAAMITSETVGGGSTFDYYPDKYMITTSSGLNSSFIYDYMDGKPVLEKYSDTKIETVYGNVHSQEPYIKGFKVTAPNGVVYFFGQSSDGSRSKMSYDRTVRNYVYINNTGNVRETPGDGNIYMSSWHLMEIQTPEGRKVEFFYTNYEESYYYRKGADVQLIVGADSPTPAYGPIESSFSRVMSMQHHIEKIKFSEGTLEFVKDASATREDLVGGRRLKEVILKDPSGVEIKRYVLNHRYTEGIDGNQLEHLRGLGPEGKKRLFLDKIDVQKQITTGSSTQIIDLQPPYKFKYNPMVLPSRYSTSQDAWGYFNNASNGRFLTFFDVLTADNRKVNTTALAAGNLEEIIYPTGGSTRLSYEPNVVKRSYVNKEIVFPANGETETKTVTLTKKDFVVSQAGIATLKYSLPKSEVKIYFACKHLQIPGLSGIPDCIFNLAVSTNGTSYSPLAAGGTTTRNTDTLFLHVKPTGDTDAQDNLLFLNDNYDFSITLRYEAPKYNKDELYGGGRRVIKVENFESAGNISSVKSYSYRDGSSASTGELLGLPGYILKGSEIPKDKQFAGAFPVYFQHGNYPGSPLSTSQGNSVGYGTVTEYIGTAAKNSGKLVSTYFLIADTGSGYNYPYNFPNSHEWFRGSLLKEATFKSYLDKGKLAYEKVKEVENWYQYAGMLNESMLKSYQKYTALNQSIAEPKFQYFKNRNSYRLPLIKFIVARDLRALILPEGQIDANVRNQLFETYKVKDKTFYVVPDHAYYYKTFSFTGGAVDLMRSITRTYEDGQLMSVETNNFYDYANHYALARTETTNSKGELVKSVFTYPEDGHPLKVQNRIQPIKAETFNKSSKLLTQQTNFDTFGSLYLAKEVKTGKGELGSTGGLETRLIYHGYDVKGNPTEVSQQDGIHITYLWGYDYTKPVAKIENASYAQVMTALGKQSTDNLEYLQTMNDAALQVVMTKLRANLPTAQVSSYTYIPLVGVSTITDPRGQKMTYHYDAFNRLQYVKDSQGNILKEHKYNYKN